MMGSDPKGSGPIKIPPIDQKAQELCRKRWDSLTKPQGSLGRLEEIAVQMAGITGKALPSIQRKVIFTVAGDHGVVAEGVSAYPQAVTAQMVFNFLNGGAGINVLARQVGAEVLVVDAGVASSTFLAAPAASAGKCRASARDASFPAREGLILAKVRPGTGNMVKEPAMTRPEAERTLQVGGEIFRQAHQAQPIDLVGLGDMGIGNTTAASALTAVLTSSPAKEVTGRGTGLSEAQWAHKVRVIEEALDRHRPSPNDPVGCLAAIGGLEIGCLGGILLAAAQDRVPIVLDGFIATSAALLAYRIEPMVREYLIASHRSEEPGHAIQLKALGLEAYLNLKMRLGEGAGAALAFFLIEASLRLLKEMATFEEAGVAEKLK